MENSREVYRREVAEYLENIMKGSVGLDMVHKLAVREYGWRMYVARCMYSCARTCDDYRLYLKTLNASRYIEQVFDEFLNEEQKNIFHILDRDGLIFAEAAEKLGVSKEKFKSMRSCAIQKLQGKKVMTRMEELLAADPLWIKNQKFIENLMETA